VRIGIQIDISETFGKDHSYRYGGDEFLVLYPDATEEEFKEKLDLMMKSRLTIEINGMRSNVGFSAGYVHDILDEPPKLRSLFAAADERMY
jgi:GGDEF domain-containing protein